ncbi:MULTISPECIES: ethanolamine ammonia-lyase subunit EutC [unclassified Bradyrhizobium]|uniref:ethanolamine ammonia-lyase subunit EutC n=1 Tax=unclassified Bradyrhizobium TaxID=2631580 RepID=UPI00102E6210|nr:MULTISPECIES: ethanolamine ammonia-lyase subunit EutC [unclassified Bradyrhizobium]MDI4235445.1 ethanolamine ammonia-lyase subunit EutC [Bradyrhizobium sp. Arg237L]TAI67319.1 ethanolamine ammonia-lyase [Bradyrhizobium sp. Leo170]
MKDEREGTAAASFDLRQMTDARVRLGRFGAGVPTRAAQSFLLDHARARQAVWSEVNWASLRAALGELKLGIVEVESQAIDRATYVRRPDLGRKLSTEAAKRLAGMRSGADIVIIVADGLSANAIDANAVPLVRAIVERLLARRLSIAPLVLTSQARVALGDPIAETLRAQICIMVIGERPGLSAADSAGVYVTYSPQSGTPDSRRNCISNIRAGGLGIDNAADGVASLVADMLKTGISGVGLKNALETYCREAVADVAGGARLPHRAL